MSEDASKALSLWQRARSFVYDKAITPFTSTWYFEVLQHLPEGSRLLDVGIGTGAALVANASLLRAKQIFVLGVDYDSAYVSTCRELVSRARLGKYITVQQADIYDFTPGAGRLFDHVYFSGSFMILPKPVEALRKVVDLLIDREDGRIYFTQTFELNKNRWMEWVKPKLSRITSIDFGNVSYEGDFEEALYEGGVVVETSEVIEDGNRVEGTRECRLIVARSSLYVSTTTETTS